jgi:predicted nucleotidyltransferase
MIDFKNIKPDDTPLYKKYLDILNEFISSKEIDNFIICGSFAKQSLKVGSDIDLFVIDESLNTLEQRDFSLNGIKIDVIKCSRNKTIEILDEEKNSFMRRISSFLSSGVSVNADKKSTELIQYSKKVFSLPVPKLKGEDLLKIKEFIERHKRLSKDYIERYSDLSYFSRISFAIQELIQYYFKLNKQILPNWKDQSESIKDTPFKTNLISFYTKSTAKEKHEIFTELLLQLEDLVQKYK